MQPTYSASPLPDLVIPDPTAPDYLGTYSPPAPYLVQPPNPQMLPKRAATTLKRWLQRRRSAR